MYLLEEGHVAAVPGAPFGAPANMRFSYAASMENLEKAFDRVEKVLGNLD